MTYLGWIFKFALFVLVLIFALRNTDLVTVRYYFGGEWQTPLVFALLVAFCIGVTVGLMATLTQLVRQRREIAALKRALPAAGGSASGVEPARSNDA
jgi:lipopolysaccharide assembly protein A